MTSNAYYQAVITHAIERDPDSLEANITFDIKAGPPARLSSVQFLEAAGFPPMQMPSGAGHDAMVMAACMPTAMLFLRSPGGISHHPAEAVREEDVEAALKVGCKFLQRMEAEVG